MASVNTTPQANDDGAAEDRDELDRCIATYQNEVRKIREQYQALGYCPSWKTFAYDRLEARLENLELVMGNRRVVP